MPQTSPDLAAPSSIALAKEELAADIEHLILANIHATLADPTAPPEARDAAIKEYFQWCRADLARRRLALDKANFEATKEPPPKPFQVHDPTQEEINLILDKLDEITGIKRVRQPVETEPPPPSYHPPDQVCMPPPAPPFDPHPVPPWDLPTGTMPKDDSPSGPSSPTPTPPSSPSP